MPPFSIALQQSFSFDVNVIEFFLLRDHDIFARFTASHRYRSSIIITDYVANHRLPYRNWWSAVRGNSSIGHRIRSIRCERSSETRTTRFVFYRWFFKHRIWNERRQDVALRERIVAIFIFVTKKKKFFQGCNRTYLNYVSSMTNFSIFINSFSSIKSLRNEQFL